MIEIPESITTVIDGSLDYIYSFEPLVAKTVILGTCRPF